MNWKEFLKKYQIAIILAVILIISYILLFGVPPIGRECGYWNFFESSQKKCKCIGIETGGCSLFATCDGATYYCLGMCKDCVCTRINSTTHNWEEFPCD